MRHNGVVDNSGAAVRLVNKDAGHRGRCSKNVASISYWLPVGLLLMDISWITWRPWKNANHRLRLRYIISARVSHIVHALTSERTRCYVD